MKTWVMPLTRCARVHQIVIIGTSAAASGERARVRTKSGTQAGFKEHKLNCKQSRMDASSLTLKCNTDAQTRCTMAMQT